ncbi:hypothetical protein [Phyllobacterium sp. SB3]|uniref:hypothetical protein n=1 Tax=Phyllobacterium sp. SB3 TaxID=3156073 RepID=UPI0032AF5688
MSSGEKTIKNDHTSKVLLLKQMRDRSFKEAMGTRFSIIPNDDVFRELLDRLEEAEPRLR